MAAEKVCEHCGKGFEIPDAEVWAYRRVMRMPGDYRGKVHWFCKWTCMEAAQRKSDEYYAPIYAEQQARDKLRRKEAARRKREKQKKRQRTM